MQAPRRFFEGGRLIPAGAPTARKDNLDGVPSRVSIASVCSLPVDYILRHVRTEKEARVLLAVRGTAVSLDHLLSLYKTEASRRRNIQLLLQRIDNGHSEDSVAPVLIMKQIDARHAAALHRIVERICFHLRNLLDLSRTLTHFAGFNENLAEELKDVRNSTNVAEEKQILCNIETAVAKNVQAILERSISSLDLFEQHKSVIEGLMTSEKGLAKSNDECTDPLPSRDAENTGANHLRNQESLNQNGGSENLLEGVVDGEPLPRGKSACSEEEPIDGEMPDVSRSDDPVGSGQLEGTRTKAEAKENCSGTDRKHYNDAVGLSQETQCDSGDGYNGNVPCPTQCAETGAYADDEESPDVSQEPPRRVVLPSGTQRDCDMAAPSQAHFPTHNAFPVATSQNQTQSPLAVVGRPRLSSKVSNESVDSKRKCASMKDDTTSKDGKAAKSNHGEEGENDENSPIGIVPQVQSSQMC